MGKTLEVIGVILAGIKRDLTKAKQDPKKDASSLGLWPPVAPKSVLEHAVAEVKAQTNLMLVPESIVQQTADEFQRHAPQLKVLVLPAPFDPKINENIMVAKAKYTARNDQELPLDKNDVIIVTSIVDPHWCMGRKRTDTKDKFVPRNRLAPFKTAVKVTQNNMICVKCNGVGMTYSGWTTIAGISMPVFKSACTWCYKAPCLSCVHTYKATIVPDLSGEGARCRKCRAGVLAHDDAIKILKGHDVVIAAHGSLLNPPTHATLLRSLKSVHWRRVIVDECQFMLDRLDRKNANGQAGTFETRLFNGIKTLWRDFFYAVSGTPIAGDLHKGCANLLKLWNM